MKAIFDLVERQGKGSLETRRLVAKVEFGGDSTFEDIMTLRGILRDLSSAAEKRWSLD